MIQTAAPTVANATPPAPGQPAGQTAKGPEKGHFAQVLADQGEREERPQATTSSAAVPTDAAPATATPDADQAEMAATSDAVRPPIAGTLPAGGKTLPVALPQPAAATDAPASTETKDSAAQTIPTLLAAVRAIRVSTEETAAPKPSAPAAARGDDDSADTTAEPGDAAPALPIAAAVLAVLPQPLTTAPANAPAQPQSATGAALPPTNLAPPAAATPNSAAAQPQLPPAVAAQMAGLPLPASPEAPAAPAAQQDAVEPALALKIDPASPSAAPAPAVSFEPAPARPMAGVRLRPVLASEASTSQAAAPTNPGLDLLGQAAGPMAAPAATPVAPFTGAAPLSRPHDFAGLVDRLIAARDAAQTGLPQSVHMSVNHAEFGPISLNFQHDQRGLAVSVASPDPEFARAVQAAIPAASAATADNFSRDTRQGSGQQGAPAQSFARADNGGAGQSNQRQPGHSAAFATDRSGPAANPANRQDEASARPRGIFA